MEVEKQLMIAVRQLIACIDRLVKKQLAAVLDHPAFVDLFANWSCLKYLISVADSASVKIKLLDLKWSEAIILAPEDNELDSLILRKVFDDLDMPGGHPISLIVGSYRLDVSDRKTTEVLSHFATVCAYNFVPFITNITSDVFDVEDFSQLSRLNIDEIYKNKKFHYLMKLAADQNSTFLGFTISKLYFPSLINKNAGAYSATLGDVASKYNYVLGNPAYGFAAVIINSFINTGWFLDIVGPPMDQDGQITQDELGVIPLLRSRSFFSELYPCINEIFFKPIAQTVISEHKEKELSDLGIISVCHIRERDFAVIYSTNSLRTLYTKMKEGKDFEVGNILQYMLCVCRFSHYIRIIARQKLGLYSNLSEFVDYLNKWLLDYISSDVETPLYLRNRYPLLDAKIEVTEDNLLNNNFICKIYLKPHLMSMNVSADIILRTKISLPIASAIEA